MRKKILQLQQQINQLNLFKKGSSISIIIQLKIVVAILMHGEKCNVQCCIFTLASCCRKLSELNKPSNIYH